MNRLSLERQQVWLYLSAILLGLMLGSFAPNWAAGLDVLLWPMIALLLYATFVQVPLLHVRDAFADLRFLAAVLLGNFVLIPLALWSLLDWLPEDPVLRLGVLLVLLVPCTDWFITFTQLGRGDTARAIAVSPLNLLLQLLLLPLWLWLMFPKAELAAAIEVGTLLPAAALLIGLPLLAAAASERWIEARRERAIWRERLAWWPVPLLALVVLLIAATQVGAALEAAALLPTLLPLFVGFLVFAAVLARALAGCLKLPAAAARTLAFSLGTRNSFVVLPLALALPAGWETAVVVIVLQSLVELFGMLAYLLILPRWFADPTGPEPGPNASLEP